MKQATTILLTLLILLAGQTLRAEVDPVNIVLHDSNTTYSVPAGKVLIIEHFIWALEADSTHQSVAITPANAPVGVGSFQLKFTALAPDSWTYSRPIRVAGGSGADVHILKDDLVDWRDVMIVGLLVDYADLYAAAIDSNIESLMLAGDDLHLQIALASPRPAIVRTQRASEVAGPYQSTSNRPTKTVSSGVWHLEESLDWFGQRGFLRSSARARESE